MSTAARYEPSAAPRGSSGPACGDGAPAAPARWRREDIRCNKCKNAAARGLAMVRGQWMCRVCLCAGVAGKVRQLSTVSSVARGLRILVATNGDAAGICALHVLAHTVDTVSRPRFTPQLNVLLVETTLCLDMPARLAARSGSSGSFPPARADAELARLVRFVLGCGFGIVIVPLTAVFASPSHVDSLAVSALGASMAAGCTKMHSTLPEHGCAIAAADAALCDSESLDASVAGVLGDYAALRASAAYIDAHARLRACFDTLMDADAAQDMVKLLSRRVQLHVAATRGYQALCTCETLDDLAVDTLVQTCHGRGAALPLDVSYNDVRWLRDSASLFATARSDGHATPDEAWGWYAAPVLTPNLIVPSDRVALIRPLADVEVKEAALYCFHHGLPTCSFPTFHTLSQPTASMHGCTTRLLRGLQQQFPQTVHAVVRTVRKLQLPVVAAAAPLSTVDELTATDSLLEPTRSSPSLCTLCGAYDAQLAGSVDHAAGASVLIRRLCHGCRVTLEDMHENQVLACSLLPTFSRTAAWECVREKVTAASHEDRESTLVDFDVLKAQLLAEGALLEDDD